MRRLIQNSTAIAATLAMLVPQTGWAEMRIPDAQAELEGPARAAAMPAEQATLQAELDAGLGVDGLVCADGAARPCADGVALTTPQGVAVQVADGGAIILAPAGQQGAAPAVAAAEDAAAADLEAALAEATGSADAAAAADAETAADTLILAEAREKDGGKGGGKEADKAARDAEKAADKAAKEAEKASREAEKATEKAAKEADKATEKATREAEKATEKAAKETEKASESASAGASAGPAESVTESAAESAAGSAAAGSDAAAETAGAAGATSASEPPAASAPAEAATEPAAGSGAGTAAADTAAAAEAAAATASPAKPVLIIPPKKPAVAPAAEPAASTEAAATEAAAAEAAAAVPVPEVGTTPTEAAKEAAAEEAAPAVAAMDETAQPPAGAQVTEETVTEANTRSSDEDFETSLSNALAQAAAATKLPPAQAEKDHDNNDLAKALLLGIGAIAVGTMLNNNREVALATPDRVVVQMPDGSQQVIKDEVALLRQPGSTVTTENFDDGSSRTIVTRPDGSKVVTIRDSSLRVLRRTLISADGVSTQLIDDTATVEPVDLTSLPPAAKPVVVASAGPMSESDLRAALAAEADINRRFTLGQIRNIPEVRALVAPVDIAAITFETGSAAIKPDQARQLATLGKVISEAVTSNPREIFMIEGYTDTVGSAASNLALSDRRAESVALALTEYFRVPPENMVVQGYGEQFLKVRQEGDIRENRRASVRRITDLLRTAAN